MVFVFAALCWACSLTGATALLQTTVELRGVQTRIFFEREEQPLIVAHRVLSKAGVLDQRKGAVVSRAVRRAIREDELRNRLESSRTLGGLLLDSPADGAQFAVGETIPFLIEFLLPPTSPQEARDTSVCVTIQSFSAAALDTERNTTQCFGHSWADQGANTTANGRDAISWVSCSHTHSPSPINSDGDRDGTGVSTSCHSGGILHYC